MGAKVVMIKDVAENLRKIISECSRIAVGEMRTRYITYIGQKNSQEQNSFHMYHCISKSITKSVQLNIVK